MPWHGRISNFRSLDDRWLVDVDYYSDANPDRSIPRSLDFPLGITRAEVISAIQQKGQEVRSFATLNTQNIIGSIIDIP